MKHRLCTTSPLVSFHSFLAEHPYKVYHAFECIRFRCLPAKGLYLSRSAVHAQQLKGICCSLLSFSKVHCPNSISSSKSRQMERGTVGNTPVSKPGSYRPSLTLWRAAGRNQEGQDAVLTLMRPTVNLLKKNRT